MVPVARIGRLLLGGILMSVAIHCPAGDRPYDCRSAAGPVPAQGSRVYCARSSVLGREASYHLQLPSRDVEGAPVLVVVHGISRNAREQVDAFGERAARLGVVTVAPLFSRRHFRSYQRLGHSRRGVESAPHVALEAILSEVAETTGADTSRVFLFGFSGGAQFAHRFTMRYPERVRSLVVASAGWYTFPDVEQPFPRGIGPTPLTTGTDPQRFLRVPTLVLVGESDGGRDDALNTSRVLDLQQGRTRIERGRRWREAMLEVAQRSRIDARFDFALMPGCGHDFGDCVERGALVGRVLDFLLATTRRPLPRPRRDGSVLFTAGG
jgi:pimeloyl-ACP methyl ester carboxylesterase